MAPKQRSIFAYNGCTWDVLSCRVHWEMTSVGHKLLSRILHVKKLSNFEVTSKNRKDRTFLVMRAIAPQWFSKTIRQTSRDWLPLQSEVGKTNAINYNTLQSTDSMSKGYGKSILAGDGVLIKYSAMIREVYPLYGDVLFSVDVRLAPCLIRPNSNNCSLCHNSRTSILLQRTFVQRMKVHWRTDGSCLLSSPSPDPSSLHYRTSWVLTAWFYRKLELFFARSSSWGLQYRPLIPWAGDFPLNLYNRHAYLAG